jgi:hypothetical protein
MWIGKHLGGWMVVGLASALAAGGCDGTGSAAAPEGVYIGAVEGGPFVAVVVDDGAVLAYACDGDVTGVSVYAWLEGQVDGGRVAAVHAEDPVALDATFDGEVLTGVLDLDGATLGFTAVPAAGDAGLYTAVESDLRGGWIFDQDGTQRGAVLNRNTGDVASILLTSSSQASISAFSVTLMVHRVQTVAP